MIAYLSFAGAILLELVGTTALKLSGGFTRFGPALLVLASYGGAFALLAIAVKSLPLGFVYAVWAGAGIGGAKTIGVLMFDERVTAWSAAGTMVVIAGIVTLVIEPSRASASP